jgi:exosortase/archaeosortase family protein
MPITPRLALSLAGVIAVLVLLEQAPELQRPLEPVNLGLARATELLLRYLDVPVARQGAILMHPDGFSYRITYVCSGFRPAALIAVTLLMVPATWLSRLTGVCVAVVGIEALNLGRLVHLYWIGVMDPDAFFMAHRVTWNIVTVVAVVAYLALWIGVKSGLKRGRLKRGQIYFLPGIYIPGRK